ncbi:MAG: helix-turn-helix transcriptional regulator [Verrucomicrobia bacterium]|nr:helix-turn-helix transcriptional regulator [Verrucomicrobiota bacterium]
MPVPRSTSAEALDRYAAGRRTTVTKGPAWKDVRLTIMSLPPVSDIFTMPAVTEPFIAWISSGDAEAQEREGDGPWVTSRLQRDSMFLTTGGAPYDFRFKTLTPEPFEVVLVILSLGIFNEALEEVYGKEASRVRLRDLSGFRDPALTVLLQKLRDEAMLRAPSRLFVRGIAQAVAVYLARNYAVVDDNAITSTPSLPGFKLRRIIEWMTENMADDFSLAKLAKQAGLSEFHFTRLFKRATGVPPLQYQIKIRMDAARRLLRESELSVITIANQVGYSTPSHFAQVFRKETGLTPRDYRRER